MKKVAFHTLGCKVNQYETEAITELFLKEGYEVVDFEGQADVYIINTCTVTGLSARKSRQMIRRARVSNRDAVVAVVGCYSQTAPEEVEAIPGVNIIVGTKDRKRLVEYVKQIEGGKSRLNVVDSIMTAREFEDLGIEQYEGRTRAYLKIQEGCSQFCSYCIIPYARGPIRSRPPEDVLAEVEKLSLRGFKEIVLTGIHVASYGRELKTTSLMEIIRQVHKVEGIERIRLGSIEPTTIDKAFIETAEQLPKLCPHYHISLQSGCDETLKRMNRRYTTGEYREAVRELRKSIPGVAVTTDVMVGFPGETEEEFESTRSFLEEMAFAQMHVFKYSPRKGTPAAAFTDQVPPEAKDARSNILLEMSQRLTKAFNSSFTGKVMPVLFEQAVKAREGYVEGLTVNYIRVMTRVGEEVLGKLAEVRIKAAEEDYAVGEIV